MTIFEELKALDNPWVDFTISFSAEKKTFAARRLTAAETDALEAYFADQYARLITEKTETHGEKASELDRVRTIYRTRPRKDLIEQVLGTRPAELNQRAYDLAGLDPKDVQKRGKEITDEKEREDYKNSIRAALEDGLKRAKEEMAIEYESRSDDELADIMAQVNINISAQGEASTLQAQQRLYYMVYLPDRTTRVFPSLESVRELQAETLQRFLKSIDAAFLLQVARDFPFESPVGPERDGQPSSAKPSEQGTTLSHHGGRRTRRRRRNSKPSTKPA